jgi:hypothetical protein
MYSTVAEKEAAEITRLERAIEQFPGYTLEEDRTLPGFFTVTGGARTYRTSATSCSCPDAQHRGVRCKHQALIQGRLLAESPAEKAERRAEAKRVRDLLWAD